MNTVDASNTSCYYRRRAELDDWFGEGCDIALNDKLNDELERELCNWFIGGRYDRARCELYCDTRNGLSSGLYRGLYRGIEEVLQAKLGGQT